MKTYLTNNNTYITECRLGEILLISEDKDRDESRKGCIELLKRRWRAL